MMDSRLPFRGKEVRQVLTRIHRDEGGFTLIELLVTISILAVLFGIVALSLTGVASSATTQVNAAELGVVQSAVDIYMAVQNSSTITARTTADEIESGDISGDAPFATYLRQLPTRCQYTWNTSGTVSQGTCP